MAREIEELARFVAETKLEQIPPDVQRYAKLVALDTLGVILAGASRPEVRGLRERLVGPAGTAGRGATVFAPGWPEGDPRTSRIVFITQDLPRSVVEAGARAFAAAAEA